MKKVAYIALADDGSSYYRCQGVFPFIKNHGLELVDISDKNIHSWAPIADCDILFIQRPFLEEHCWIIKQARMMGKKVIVDWDDNALVVPEHNPAYQIYQSNRRHVLECLRLADEVWVSTQGIADDFVKYNQNIFIIPNCHNDYLFPVSQKRAFNFKNKTVVYRGGETHRMDLYAHAGQLITAARDNQDWKFTYIGAIDNHEFSRVNQYNSNVYLTSKMPIIQYLDYLYTLNAEVMINPLEHTALNRAKSNISWIEGTYAGSAFFGSLYLPEFVITGIYNFTVLENGLKANPDLLKESNNFCWNYIKENLLLSKINEQRITRLLAC